MKIVDIKAGQRFSTQQPHVRIYPFINQEQDAVIDDPESEWYGESMGYVAAFEDRIELNYGWDDIPTWGVDDAEAFARAILKAVEFSREMQAKRALSED